jgi:hypothetical protein
MSVYWSSPDIARYGEPPGVRVTADVDEQQTLFAWYRVVYVTEHE